jgi:hypothetical protein
MRLTMIALALILSFNANCDEIFRIQVGKDYQRYSQSDLQKRVWELERAVWQLQQRVFELEGKPQTAPDTWVCSLTAMGETFTGTGPTKALASAKAIASCKTGKDTFFCKDPKCEQ